MVQNTVVTQEIHTMHNVVILATFNLLFHRKNKKKRQSVENRILNAVQEPIIQQIFYGEKNEQETTKADFVR